MIRRRNASEISRSARRTLGSILLTITVFGLAAAHGSEEQAAPEVPAVRPLELKPVTGNPSLLHGSYDVFENREKREGLVISLNVHVLKATGPDPKPDPVFLFAGGPGQAATAYLPGVGNSWMREDRDIVLIDQRGTGESNPLRCELPGGNDDPQAYLEPIFDEKTFRNCSKQLSDRANLRLYTTPIAVDDANEIRQALGYGKINVMGGSYGSRAAMIYMRRHPETVRTSTLTGVAPVSFRNPLYHAREAQKALELIFAACAEQSSCKQAFPELSREFDAIIRRLTQEPVTVTSEQYGELSLSREAFAEALRVMMYYPQSASRVPLLIHGAHEGDYAPFVELGIQSSRGIRDQLAFGMLLSVTCSEDVIRINEDEIPRLTSGTFLGDGRVRRQMNVCRSWPKGKIPPSYAEPVSVEVPTLLISGTIDPVTSPDFAAEAARNLPQNLHLVVPGSHAIADRDCIDSITAAFLDRGSLDGLDTSCVESMKLPAFAVPAAESSAGG